MRRLSSLTSAVTSIHRRQHVRATSRPLVFIYSRQSRAVRHHLTPVTGCPTRSRSPIFNTSLELECAHRVEDVEKHQYIKREPRETILQQHLRSYSILQRLLQPNSQVLVSDMSSPNDLRKPVPTKVRLA